jgi:hypothetical protein
MTATTRHLAGSGARRGAVLALSGLVAAAVVLAGAHLADVHHSYGLWAWAPVSPTPRIPYSGEEYARAGSGGARPAGYGRVGSTWDDLPVFGPDGSVPTGLAVQLPSGTFVLYAPLGGP